MRRHVLLLLLLAACAGRPGADVRRVEMEIARTSSGPDASRDEAPEPPPRSELGATFDGICELVGGVVRCAGRNMWGEVGDGTRDPHPDWVRVPGTEGAVQLAAGGQHVCVRIMDGTARCSGQNEFGQLGDGVGGEPRVAPVNVAGLRDIVELRTGLFHTCARIRSGDVLCWGGKIDSVQLQYDRDPASRLHPTRIARAASQVAVGHERSYARTSEGWVTWAPNVAHRRLTECFARSTTPWISHRAGPTNARSPQQARSAAGEQAIHHPIHDVRTSPRTRSMSRRGSNSRARGCGAGR